MVEKTLFCGIDPGSKESGYFMLSKDIHCSIDVVGGGTVILNGLLRDRVFELYNFFSNLFESSSFKNCDRVVICIENPFLGRNVRSSFVLVAIKTVFMILSKKFSFGYEEITPKRIRRILCGTAEVDKEMVSAFIRTVLHDVTFSSQHESDAAAAAFASTLLS